MTEYNLRLCVTKETWGMCYVKVDANSELEAAKKFKADPWSYEWDHWKTYDTKVTQWDFDPNYPIEGM